MTEEKSNLMTALDSCVEIAGKAAPKALIGFMTGGSAGAITGALIGATEASWGLTIRMAGQELAERLLGPRGEMRMGAVLSWAHQKLETNLYEGKSANPGYFRSVESEPRLAGDENLEAVLLAAQKEYEERKLPYLANLMGNLPFGNEFSKEHSNQLISLAQALSYRQLQLLILFFQPEDARREVFKLPNSNYRGRSNFTLAGISLLQDVHFLYSQCLLGAGTEGALLGLSDVNPFQMKSQGNGVNLINLMELQKVPVSELETISRGFSF